MPFTLCLALHEHSHRLADGQRVPGRALPRKVSGACSRRLRATDRDQRHALVARR